MLISVNKLYYTRMLIHVYINCNAKVGKQTALYLHVYTYIQSAVMLKSVNKLYYTCMFIHIHSQL